MARTFRGSNALEAAHTLRDTAKTVAAFRQALAVLLPLEQGLSLEQTALTLGLSKGATSRIRNQFLAHEQGPTPKTKSAYIKVLPQRREKEAAILEEVLSDAAQGGVVVIPPLKSLIETKLGKVICLASLYNMLRRHGWRKLAPDTSHPKGDPQARDAWKKNSAPI